VKKNPLFSVAGPGEKLARRSLFLAAPGAGILMAQTMLAQNQAAQTPAAPTPVSAGPPAAPGPAVPPVSLLPPPVKVGVLNLDAALAGTKEGQKAQTELEAKLGPKFAELKKLNEDIQDLQKRLDQGGAIMAASSKTDLQNSIQTKTRQLQRGQQDFTDEENKEKSVVLADLYSKIEQIISKYATENGFAVILNIAQENTPVLWVSNQIEITQAITEAYDKAAPLTPRSLAPAKPPAPAASKPTPPASTPARPPAAPAPAPAKP
jgi:outer membrane protein